MQTQILISYEMYFIQSLNYSQQKYSFEFKYIKDIRCCHVMSVFNCKIHTRARSLVHKRCNRMLFFGNNCFAIQPAKSLKNYRVIISKFTTNREREASRVCTPMKQLDRAQTGKHEKTKARCFATTFSKFIVYENPFANKSGAFPMYP